MNKKWQPACWIRACSTTSSEGGDLALLIEGIREALGSSQHLLVCWLEGLLEELQGTNMGCSHPRCEPNPAELDDVEQHDAA